MGLERILIVQLASGAEAHIVWFGYGTSKPVPFPLLLWIFANFCLMKVFLDGDARYSIGGVNSARRNPVWNVDSSHPEQFLALLQFLAA